MCSLGVIEPRPFQSRGSTVTPRPWLLPHALTPKNIFNINLCISRSLYVNSFKRPTIKLFSLFKVTNAIRCINHFRQNASAPSYISHSIPAGGDSKKIILAGIFKSWIICLNRSTTKKRNLTQTMHKIDYNSSCISQTGVNVIKLLVSVFRKSEIRNNECP